MEIVITREELYPSPIDKATVVKVLVNNIQKQFEILPNEGYVLHNNVRDWIERNEETGEEILRCGYSTAMSSCPASYDFNENPSEFYAVPADSVPTEQIF